MKLRKIIMILFITFLCDISYSGFYYIQTKINEIVFFTEKHEIVEKKLEKVNKNKERNKNGKLYIELADGSIVKGTYDNGYLQGKLIITNKKDDEYQEYNYKNNLKNGVHLIKSKTKTSKVFYRNDLVEGKTEFKSEKVEIYSNYINGKENGIKIVIDNIGKYYIPMLEGKSFGKLKIEYNDGTIQNAILDNGYNGQVELIFPNNNRLYMTFLNNVQIGKVILIENGKKRVYSTLKDFIDNNKKYNIFNYFIKIEGEDIDSIKKKGNQYYSSLVTKNKKITYNYHNSNDFIDGKLFYKEYENDQLVKDGYYTFENGKLSGKSKIIEKNNTEMKCEATISYLNGLKEGKYIRNCENVVTITGQYKNGYRNGVFETRAKDYYLSETFKNGILIELKREILNLKETKKMKNGKLYLRQTMIVDGQKYIHKAILDGAYEKHEIIILGKEIRKYEANKQDIDIDFDFLKGAEEIIINRVK
ncbi:hypothetical protein [Oceanivirga salmonicida]|uniref:hypothetical protein n=1 Tax=Oceanivirga salmonicida TaxID=1769291 RepID=UPI0012E2C1DD|nr:hypothetical protein [Oceanivirga salmonicida]